MGEHLRHAKWSTGVGVILVAFVVSSLTPGGGVAHGASTARWDLPYPQTISYRVLGQDRVVKCGQPDAVFEQQVAIEGLDQYQIHVVAGHRGDCGRLKAEQLKRLQPSTMVVLYENAGGDSPATWPGGTWAGYYLLMNRSKASSAVTAQQTQISVADTRAFSVGDTAVMWLPTSSDPYAKSEWITVKAISGSTLTVDRDIFSTGSRSYAQAPFIAAAASGPSRPFPAFNFSNVAPINPLNGLRTKQWMATNMVNDFAPSDAGAPTLDAVEFDTAASTPPVQNTNGAVKNLDCDGDGLIDYCNRLAGTDKQVDAYGVGFDDFLRAVKQGLAVYDTDASRPAKLVLADGEMGLRSLGAADGAEFESFPSWDNYTTSSGALATLGTWMNASGAAGRRLSYAFTKDITPLYPTPSSDNPLGCVTPALGGTCRNGLYRYGMAAALLWGGASAYNNEDNFTYAQRWDEEATINQAVTGLAPGYLGAPVGTVTRTTRFTSGNLAINPTFEQDLAAVDTATGVNGSIVSVRDATTAAPGWGISSVRADVRRLGTDPSLSDTRVMADVSGTLVPGEYTVDFWAKARNNATGPRALNFGVSLQGVAGPPQTLLLTNSWKHHYLHFDLATSVSSSVVKFHVGAQIGSYWLDGLNVHRGTAGILTHQFSNGIVVLNDAFTAQVGIPLPGGPYHRINGVQDRLVNDGTGTGSTLASIEAKDGIILLRG